MSNLTGMQADMRMPLAMQLAAAMGELGYRMLLGNQRLGHMRLAARGYRRRVVVLGQGRNRRHRQHRPNRQLNECRFHHDQTPKTNPIKDSPRATPLGSCLLSDER